MDPSQNNNDQKQSKHWVTSGVHALKKAKLYLSTTRNIIRSCFFGTHPSIALRILFTEFSPYGDTH